jgi:D-alanyl-D-alanine carboxypeptidase (penicillin-binding protein 5/6)
MNPLSRRAAAVLTAVALVGGAAVIGAVPARADGPIGGPRLAEPGVVWDGAATPPPDLAATFVLADAGTGAILAAKDAHAPRPPASTLKALTALTVLPRLDPAEVYTAVYDDAAQEGSKAGMVVGAPYTVADLLHGMLLPSGNDAAHGLGNANGGVPQTVEQMNSEARRLQALDTVAVNTSGLDVPGQVSSAYDLALIGRAGLGRPDFRALVSLKSADFPGAPTADGSPRPTFKIYNQNKLLIDGYPGAVGVKTGFTTQAGRTFVGAAERDGRLLVVSMMGIVGKTEPAAAALLDWGFNQAPKAKPVGALVDPVKGAPSPAPSASPAAAPAAAPAVLPAEPAASSGRPGWAVAAGALLVSAGVLLVGFGIVRDRRAPIRRR